MDEMRRQQSVDLFALTLCQDHLSRVHDVQGRDEGPNATRSALHFLVLSCDHALLGSTQALKYKIRTLETGNAAKRHLMKTQAAQPSGPSTIA